MAEVSLVWSRLITPRVRCNAPTGLMAFSAMTEGLLVDIEGSSLDASFVVLTGVLVSPTQTSSLNLDMLLSSCDSEVELTNGIQRK